MLIGIAYPALRYSSIAFAMYSIHLGHSEEVQSALADFLSKMSIAYKEADETDYWLNLFMTMAI